MKTLYWKTRPLRRTASGGRRAHWPGVALNLALAFVLVALPVGSLVLAGLEGSFAELFGLTDALLPVIATWALALFALGLGYWLTAPLDCLPGENGEPSQQRISRRLRWDCTRAVLFGGLTAATVLAVAHTYSGWQGRRAWEAYRAEAEKRGVVFDLEKLMPPPVPDAENFAATPLLRPFQSGNPEYTVYAGRLMTPAPIVVFDRTAKPSGRHPPLTPGIFVGRRENLALWQEHYRSSTNFPKWPEPRTPAEDVLKALSLWDAELAELRSATTRASARFNTRTTEDGLSTLIPHAYAMRTVLATVQVRAVAELALNRTDEAFADVTLMFRLGDTLKHEPLLITHLTRVGMHSLTVKAIWEGMLDHRWSDLQLSKWQTELAKLNFAVELRHAMAGERAFGNRAIDFLRRKPGRLPSIVEPSIGGNMPPDGSGLRAIPSGWFYREQISYNRMFDDHIVAALPSEAGKFDAALIRAKNAAMTDELKREHRPAKAILKHRVLSNLLLPALDKAMLRACQAQVFTQLAIAACALERHRLARGSYPESLAALAPEFGPLPTDPMSGQPFRYERTADGRFRLWSVGWNGKDDGGTVALTGTAASKSRNIVFEQGDWVWPVPVE
jgi:hypothetical protein